MYMAVYLCPINTVTVSYLVQSCRLHTHELCIKNFKIKRRRGYCCKMCYTGHRTERKAKKETRVHGNHTLSLLWEVEFCKADKGRTDCRGNGRRRTNELMRNKIRKENFGV